MTNSKPTVFLPEAIRNVNALITSAQRAGTVPEFSTEYEVLHDPERAVKYDIQFPTYHMEFRKDFGSRVTLSFRRTIADFQTLKYGWEFQVGTSGTLRDIETTLAMAVALKGVADLARDIKSYLEGIELVPTAEARAFNDSENARRHAEFEAARAAEKAAEKAKLSARGKKAAASRKLNKLATKLNYKAYHRLNLLVEEGKFEEFERAIANLNTSDYQ